MSATKNIPAVGTTVRPVGSKISYQVKSTHEHGCYVEATSTSQLHYSQRRATLACCRNTGTLFDGNWRAWEVVA